MLVDKGADIDTQAKDKKGHTALHYAAIFYDKKEIKNVIDFFLYENANLEIRLPLPCILAPLAVSILSGKSKRSLFVVVTTR